MKKKKRCPKCGEIKVSTSFHKNKHVKGGLHCYCKECYNIYREDYYKKNKEKIRARFLKRKYGLTVEQYNNILKQQNYRCAICNRPQSSFTRKLDVDHNHQTLYVRGLLCRYCNSRLLRYLRDNKKSAIGLIKYLQSALENDKTWEFSKK